jgi:hypothetical protein
MNTLIIEPTTKGDYQLFVSLAKRMNVKFREEKSAKIAVKQEIKEKTFNDSFGAFEDDSKKK